MFCNRQLVEAIIQPRFCLTNSDILYISFFNLILVNILKVNPITKLKLSHLVAAVIAFQYAKYKT